MSLFWELNLDIHLIWNSMQCNCFEGSHEAQQIMNVYFHSIIALYEDCL